MLDAKIAHLGFIQNVITRMSEKGSSIKTYAITIIAGALAISDKVNEWSFMGFILFISIPLIYLNAYFYRQEVLYRKLYDDSVRARRNNNFSLNTSPYHSIVDNTFKIIFTQKSKNIFKFYTPLIIGVIAIKFIMSHSTNIDILTALKRR